MTMEEIKTKLNGNEYDFLRNHPQLGGNIQLLCIGGSHAYGTDTPESDLDLRGVATSTAEEILGRKKPFNFDDPQTDTTIYAFDNILDTLAKGSPNPTEMLGLRPDDIIYAGKYWEDVQHNADKFLSKRCVKPFLSCKDSQLKKIENKLKVGESGMAIVKLMMHAVRYLNTGIDILSGRKDFTYRYDDHDLLMSIRNGGYLGDDGLPSKAYYGLLEEQEKKLMDAAERSKLPEEPDWEWIEQLRVSVNRDIVYKSC